MSQPRTPRRSREQRMVLVEKFRSSVLRAEEFCERNNLVLGTFRKNLYVKATTAKPSSHHKPSGFKPLHVPTKFFSDPHTRYILI